jgi:hypothetical protein
MPMLDEQEFGIVATLYRDGFRLQKHIEESQQCPPSITQVEDLFQPCLDAYERLTGLRETNANSVMHHRLSLYGPPCHVCGKPLRTPRALKCMACGADRTAESPVAHDPRHFGSGGS